MANSFRLVCKKCGSYEWRREWEGALQPCACGAARYAEDVDGKPLVCWSTPQDPNIWWTEEVNG